MEIALCGRALAHPSRSDPAVAFDRARHRPADRLRGLRGKVAGDREEAVLAARIHDRQLAALQLIALVRVNLVDHLDQRVSACDQNALLAIAREHHVIAGERHRGRDACRLFAGAFHVKAGLALTLTAEHPLIKGADHRHVPEHFAQGVGRQLRIPGPVRLVVIAQHADETIGQVLHLARITAFIRARHLAGFANVYIGEIDRIAGPRARLWHVERQCGSVRGLFGHSFALPT